MEAIRHFEKIDKIENLIYMEKSEVDTSSMMMNKFDYDAVVISINGKATHTIGNKKFEVCPGDIYYFNTDRDFDKILTDKDFESFCIIYKKVDKSKLNKKRDLFYKNLRGFSERDYKEFHKSKLITNKQDLDFMSGLYKEIDKELHKKKPNYQLMLYSYFIQLSVYLSRKYYCNNQMIYSSIENPKQITDAINYIEKNYNKKIELDELSEIANMSVNNFLIKFKNTLNTTPITFINKFRIKKACELMLDKDMNITEVAYDVGFSDSNYFTRLFKRIMNQSPSKYRKIINGDID